jgi:hypothetical protein
LFTLLNVSTVTYFGIDPFGHSYPGGADMGQKAEE